MDSHILITGGTGKTGRRIAAKLRQRGLEPRIAARAAAHAGQVRFDWLDPSTFGPVVAGVRAAYLVAPGNVPEPLSAMRPFLQQALSAGVERFVLLSASSLEEGGPMMGAVHAFLKRHAPRWTVLRPTWFMQNFSENQHLPTIRQEGAIYSATGDGRVPFIDAEDIAAVAVEALVQPRFPDGDLILTGPAALSYDEVARLITQASQRRVVHRRLSEQELAARFQAGGMEPAYAGVLAAMDSAIAAGAEDRVTDEVKKVTQRAPTDFWTFAMGAHGVWQ